MKKVTLVILLISLVLMIHNSFAGSATWDLNPTSSDWNTATNWTPATVPQRDMDTATFGVSNTTSIANSDKLGIAGIVFLPGASAYSFTLITQRTVTFVGNGVVNNSGVTQSFVVGNNAGFKQATLTFTGTANAGTMTSYTNYGLAGLISFEDESSAGSAMLVNSNSDPLNQSGLIQFTGGSTADHAIFVNSGIGTQTYGGKINFDDSTTAGYATFYNQGATGGLGSGGSIQFYDSATADHGTFICKGAPTSESNGASLTFNDDSTAGNATITAEGGAVAGANGGVISFQPRSDTGDATVIANGGAATGASGGVINCFNPTGNGTFIVNGATVSGALGGYLNLSALDNATILTTPSSNGGGAAEIVAASPTIGARIELLGDGSLILLKGLQAVTVGSIEGEGKVSLGRAALFLGSNNLSTTFSGTIEDGDIGQGGMLAKIGTGTFTLTGANIYTGETIVESGILLANNTKGSGTGTNTVQVNGGTFGGGGKVSGDVIVGTGSGTGAILGPGARGIIPGTFTIKRTLTLMADATYKCTLDSRTLAADQVRAKGVIIQGAQALFDDRGNNILATGTVFTVINNTAATPISGVFANLADGATVIVGSNTFHANYEGGDGNDLTLTVVP